MSTSRADTKKWVEDFYNGIIDRNEYEDLFEKSFQAPHVEPPTPDFVAQTCTLKCNAPRSMQNEAKLYNVFINRKYAKDSTTMVYIRLRGSRDTNHIYFRDDVESGTKFGMLRGQNRFAALRKILSDKGQGVCQTALDSARVVLREFRGECLDHPEALELYVALGNKEEKCLKAQIHEMVQGVPKICDKLKSQDPKTRAQKVSEVYPGCTSEDVNNVLTYAKQGLFQKGSLSEEYSVQCVYDEKTDSNPVFSYMKNCVAPWAREYADFEKEQCVAHHILLRFGYDVALSNDDALMFQKFLLNKIYLLDHAEAKRKGRQIVQYCAKIKQRNDLAAKARKTEEDAKTLEALDADIGKYVHMFGELPLFERDDDTEATMILNKMIKFAESFIPEGFEKAPGSMSAISNHRSNIRSVDEDTKPSVGMQVRFRPEALRPELVERNPLLLSAAQGTVEKSGCDPPAESRDKLKLFSKKSLLFFAAMEKNVNRQKILQAQHRRAAGKTTVNKKMGARMPGSTTAPPDTPVKGAGARSSTADKTPPAMKVMKTAAMRNKMKMAKKKMMKKKGEEESEEEEEEEENQDAEEDAEISINIDVEEPAEDFLDEEKNQHDITAQDEALEKAIDEALAGAAEVAEQREGGSDEAKPVKQVAGQKPRRLSHVNGKEQGQNQRPMPFREMKDDRGVLEVWDPALEAYASEYTIIEDESYTSADLVDMLWPGKKRPAYVRLAKRDGETEGRVLPRDSLMIDTRHHIAEGYAGLRFELSASSIGMFLPLGNIEGPRLGQLRSRAIRFRGVPNQAHRPNTQVVLYPVQVIVNFYDVYKDFYGRNYLNVMPKNDCMLDTICTASIELAEKFGFAHSGLQAPSLRYTEKQIQCVVPKDDDRKFSTQECADMHVNFDPDLLGGFASPSKSPQKGNANSKSKPMKGKAKDDHDAAGEEEEKSGNHSMKMKQAAMKAVMKSMKTSKRGNDEEDEAEKEDEMNDSKKTKSNAGTPMKPKRSSINTLPSPLLHDKMVGQHLVPYIRDYTSNNTYDSMYGKASVLRCCILMPLVVKKKMEENQDSQASALAAAGLG